MACIGVPRTGRGLAHVNMTKNPEREPLCSNQGQAARAEGPLDSPSRKELRNPVRDLHGQADELEPSSAPGDRLAGAADERGVHGIQPVTVLDQDATQPGDVKDQPLLARAGIVISLEPLERSLPSEMADQRSHFGVGAL